MSFWVVPADDANRLTPRHDLLGPYNSAEMADGVRDTYRADGIACKTLASPTRPLLGGPLRLQDFEQLSNLLTRFANHHSDGDHATAAVSDARQHVRRIYCDLYVPTPSTPHPKGT
jgi:hypothetical protein